MNQMFFSIHLRRYTQLIFFVLCIFFSFIMAAVANDSCPDMEDHSISAVRYQLFTAFQTGYDGYQTPCDLKCLSKKQCTETCQTEKGLAYLTLELDKLKAKKNLTHCPSYSMVCLEQCKKHGQACIKACDIKEPVASN